MLGVGLGGDRDAERGKLNNFTSELGHSLGEELLRPHRSYVGEVSKVAKLVKGVAHITGGGLVENVPRMLPDGLGARIDGSSWELPSIFRLLQREGSLAEAETWRVFNMGIGLVLAADQSTAGEVCAALPDAIVIGDVTKTKPDGMRVEIL
jgi:phosphoribosylformylglycinamidine cyclo-ligase